MSRAHEVIHDRLWMSSSPAKWKPGTFEKFIDENHIKHVVALCNKPPLEEGFTWDAPTSEDEDKVVEVHHWPVKDSHKTVDPVIVQNVVPWVKKWVQDGERTLVSCLVGRSRSGITCGLVIRDIFDLNGEQALEQLRAGKPTAIKREGPEAWFRALPAPSEHKQLPPEFGES